MKHSMILTLTLCCGFLAGCSNDTAPLAAIADDATETSRPTAGAGAGSGAEAKRALMSQLRPFKSDPRVYESPEVVAAQAASHQAQLQWVKARDASPALQPLVEKANSLMSQATREAQGGDSNLARRLAGEAGVAKAGLEQAGMQLPDLAPLHQARQAAQLAVERAEIAALKTMPEARELAEQWEALLDRN
jgi:hypothetical protein